MAKQIILNKSFIRVVFVLFATVLVGQKPQDVTGTILDGNGDRVVETTVLLLAEDGTEVQRTQTSKKRLGRGGGVFEFKKVAPGKYKIDIDGGDLGKLNTDVEVSDDDVKLGDLTLSINEVASTDNSSGQQAADGADATAPNAPPTEESVEFTPDPGKDYILNELSFEIKKMTAELKYLNEDCLLYTSPSPRDGLLSRMPSSA